jgi:hypothetical protein
MSALLRRGLVSDWMGFSHRWMGLRRIWENTGSYNYNE